MKQYMNSSGQQILGTEKPYLSVVKCQHKLKHETPHRAERHKKATHEYLSTAMDKYSKAVDLWSIVGVNVDEIRVEEKENQ